MRRTTATIALIIFAVLGGVLVAPVEARAQETLIRVEWHPDPCQEIAVRVKETANVTKLLKFRGHALSMRTFAYAVCEQVREEIVDRIKKKIKKVRRDVEGEMLSRAGGLYDDFIDRLRDTVYAALPEVERARITPDEYFDRWLQNPNQEFELFVNSYLHMFAPKAAAFLDALNDETSTQILDGLQALWTGAEEKLKKLDQVYDDIQKDPKPEYVEKYLDKYGLKGPWVDKLRGFEVRFRLLDKGYGLVDAAQTMHEAFTADTYGDRLKGAFTLLEKLGGTLSSSKAPGVSLIGDLVKAYGEIAKEALERAKELEKLIRMREGMCIGLAAHSLLDERSIALEKIAPGTQACPVDVKDDFFKDIYVQTEPPNADQIYFWAGKRMIKGRDGGGGVVGVEEAKKFIIESVKIGFDAYARKENNVRAVAAVYNTIYREEDALKGVPGLSFISGLPGLRAESDALFEAITKQVDKYKNFAELNAACDERAFKQTIETETGLRLDPFPLGDTDEQVALRSKLKTSYVLGYILLKRGDLPEGGARTAAYTIYTAIWRKFASLSMVVLEGRLVRKDQSDAPCPQCANVPISVTVRNGAEMAACRVKQTDSNGRFLARLITRSAEVSAEFSAAVGTVKSERITIGKAQLNPPEDGSSFLLRFSFNLPIDIKGQTADWLASLELLRALHAQAAVQNAIATESCAAAQAAIAEIVAVRRDLSAALDAVTRQLNEVRSATGGDLGASRLRQEGAVDAARRAAEAAATLKKEAETAALRACDATAKLRGANAPSAPGEKQTLVRSISSDAAAARAAATKATQARQSAAQALKTALEIADAGTASRDTLMALAGTRQKITALTERLNAATKQAQAARQTAQAAATKLGEIAVRARPVHGDIITRVGRIGGAEAEQAVGAANGLYGAITSWHGAAVACTDAAAKAQTQANEGAAGGTSTSGQMLAGIDALLGGKDPGKLVSDLTSGADTTRSYLDVAEVMEEAARSAAEGAETCRKLAESALTQQSGDDLVAAAEAAIGICEFEKARSAIDALPAGPIRDRIADRYRASVAREQAVRALYEEARALYRSGDTAAALAKLAAARAQTACDKYAVVIDQTAAQIRAGSADTRVGAVQAAIADCRFEEARAQIDALTADHHPRASALAAEYASAYEREQRTIALWNEARALFSKGQRADAMSRLNQALANTRCSTYRSRIGAAIATLSRDSNRRETDTEQSEIEPGWTTAWKGSFRLGQVRVNGRDVDAPTLLRLIRENWLYAAQKAEQESKAGRKGVTKSILGDMEQEIGRAVVGLVMAGVDLLNQGLDWSFQMRPEGNGYRLAVPGNSPVAQKMNKGMATYPLFVPDGERRLRLTYRKAGSNTTISALMSADDQWSRVSFAISIKGDMAAKDSDYVNAIRSIDLNIDGAFEPGSIPAEQLESQLSTKFQATSKRYADELKR